MLQSITYSPFPLITNDPYPLPSLSELKQAIKTIMEEEQSYVDETSPEDDLARWEDILHGLIFLTSRFQQSCNYTLEGAKILLIPLIQLMQAKGICLNDSLYDGCHRPIYEAILYNSPALLAALIACGANIDEPENLRDGRTPLHEAASLGRAEIVLELLKGGADVNSTAAPNLHGLSKTPIIEGAQFPEIIKILHAHGANINCKCRDDLFGPTPLYKAAIHGHCLSSETLLHLGAKLYVKDYHAICKAITCKVIRLCTDTSLEINRPISEWLSTTQRIADYINILSHLNKKYTGSFTSQKIEVDLIPQNPHKLKYDNEKWVKDKFQLMRDIALTSKRWNNWIHESLKIRPEIDDLLRFLLGPIKV